MPVNASDTMRWSQAGFARIKLTQHTFLESRVDVDKGHLVIGLGNVARNGESIVFSHVHSFPGSLPCCFAARRNSERSFRLCNKSFTIRSSRKRSNHFQFITKPRLLTPAFRLVGRLKG
jgi:hypothetical protein